MILALLFSCKDGRGPDDPPLPPLEEVFSGCDPLDAKRCLFPFPSNYHLAEDDSTESGFRVSYGPTALPVMGSGLQLTPDYWNEKDGYSINSTLVFFFDDGSDEGLTDAFSIDQFDGPDAKSLWVDLETGEAIPHWLELDATADSDEQRAYIAHAAIPLEHEHAYAFAVRGLTTRSGSPVAVTEAFSALRDDTDSRNWDIEYRRATFDDVVFPAIEAHGFDRSELQLAWDFRTGSQESSIGRMVWMKDDALSRIGPNGPHYAPPVVEEFDCSVAGTTIGRQIDVTVTTPMYTETPEPGTLLTRDEAGEPFYNGETTFEVLIRVPCSVIGVGEPVRVIQYGHGLLGSRTEARSGWLSNFANDNGYIIVAADWTGMSEEDLLSIVTMSGGDPSRFAMVPERSMQGVVQQLLVMPLMHGPLKDDPALSVGGSSLIDPTRSSYYGNSQGAIMGGTVLSLSETLQRGVFGVSGMNYGLLLTRSKDFNFYFLIFKAAFDDDLDIALFVQGMVQQLWDASEGAGYLHTVNRDPLPGITPNEVLLHDAIGDNQVTTLAGHIQARAYGARLIGPAFRPVWGIEETQTEHVGSGLVEWHYSDVPDEPVENIPPAGPDPHECPRRELDGQSQIVAFFEEGVIRPACEGVCTSTVEQTCP